MLWRTSMKFLKNVFGIKQNKNTKYTQNTLAETNGSPDLRLATAKEKESDVTVSKKEDVKRVTKKSTSSATNNPEITATEVKKSEAEDTKSTVTTTSKTSSTKRTVEKKQTVSNAENTETVKKSNLEQQDNISNKSSKKTVKITSDEPIPTDKSASSSVTKKAKTQSEDVKSTAKKDVNTAKVATKKSGEGTEEKSNNSAKSTIKEETVAEDAEKTTVSKNAKTGRFEIKKTKDGRFVFNLHASNSVIVATSQVYSSSTSAVNGIKSVIANAESAPIEDQTLKKYTSVPYPKWEIYLDKGEEYRFRLCASNGSCVCHSQGYTSKANCKKGIESVIKTSKDAEIIKAYLEKNDK